MTAAARTPAQPGKHSEQQWPTHLVVEYGPVVEGAVTAGFTAKTTPVLLDGEQIGEIRVARQQTFRMVKGMNLRQPTGYANRWKITARRGPVARPGIDVHFGNRAEATAALIRFHLTGDTRGQI